MSSAISTESAPVHGRASRRARAKQPHPPAAPSPQAPDTADNGFQVWHFFVLLSLVAATVAVMMSRQNTPEHLVLTSLAIGAAGAASFGLYRMLAPLTATESELVNEPISDRLRAHFEREKALTLRSIKELEFDRAMGKLSQADFDEMAGRLRARAIGIMKQLDEGGTSAYRALIEREVAARIGAAPGERAPAERPAVAPAAVTPAAATPAAADIVSQGLCSCGTQNDADARFCKSCGSKLS